jgi:hypothetical protein
LLHLGHEQYRRLRGIALRLAHAAARALGNVHSRLIGRHAIGYVALTTFFVLTVAQLPAFSARIEPKEVPVVAILIDGRETVNNLARLNQLAAELPFTPNFMVCVLQSASCGSPISARDTVDRPRRIQQALAVAEQRARREAGVPRTDDLYRILNGKVRQAFKDFWDDLRDQSKEEHYRQIWVVLVTPTLYLDIGQRGTPEDTVHNSRVPDACFPGTIQSADLGPEARLRIIIAVPASTRAGNAYGVYPDSAVDILSKIAGNSGQRRLDGIYQMILDCPRRSDNVRNWMGRSVPSQPNPTCVIQPGAQWANYNNKAEFLSCAQAAATPRALFDQILNAPIAQAGLQPPPPLPPPRPDPQAQIRQPDTPPPRDRAAKIPGPSLAPRQPESPAPPRDRADDVLPAPAPSPRQDPTRLSPPPDKPAAMPDRTGEIPVTPPTPRPVQPEPVPVRPAPPQAGTPADAQRRAPQPSPPAPPASGQPTGDSPRVATSPTTPESSPAPQSQARPVQRSRPGPDPNTIVALADAQPAPVVGGTLVKRPATQPSGSGPTTIEFTGSSGGLDLGLQLVAPGANAGRTVGASSTNRLVIGSPIAAGTYRIVLAVRPRDASCTAGRLIRGTLTATGQTVTPASIAVNLEVSNCPKAPIDVVVGTLEVR